uniref:C3H1-type domain-containing protein n=1 Tax=Meloidogyne floridensis TaxID=298350 RepID=A0A915P8I3_9BILA
MSDTESNNGTIKMNNNVRLKVSICNTWLRKGYCPRGLACIYAHGTDELQDGESDEKKQPTVICKYWFTTGWCRSGDSCRFLHPLNDKRTQNDENLNENENKVSDSSANVKDENSSVRGGKKNFGSLLSLSNDPPPSQKTSGGSNNQKINNNNNNTAKINSLNNCFLSANRLKFPTIPPPLMTENVGTFGFFHSRRNGNAGGSSSGERLSAKGGNKFQQRNTQDSFDDDDELVLLDKRFNKMENNNVFGSNKNG